MSLTPGLEAKLVVAVLPLVDAYGREALGRAMAAMSSDMLAGTPSAGRDLENEIKGLKDALRRQGAGNCLKCNCGPRRASCAYPEACEHPARELAGVLNQVLLTIADLPTSLDMFVPYDCERCHAHISGGTSNGPVCLRCRMKEKDSLPRDDRGLIDVRAAKEQDLAKRRGGPGGKG